VAIAKKKNEQCASSCGVHNPVSSRNNFACKMSAPAQARHLKDATLRAMQIDCAIRELMGSLSAQFANRGRKTRQQISVHFDL
jgi:hypothetical protein